MCHILFKILQNTYVILCFSLYILSCSCKLGPCRIPGLMVHQTEPRVRGTLPKWALPTRRFWGAQPIRSSLLMITSRTRNKTFFFFAAEYHRNRYGWSLKAIFSLQSMLWGKGRRWGEVAEGGRVASPAPDPSALNAFSGRSGAQVRFTQVNSDHDRGAFTVLSAMFAGAGLVQVPWVYKGQDIGDDIWR